MQRSLDAKKRHQVLAVVSVGGTRTLAAKVVGCHPRTIYNTAKSDTAFAEDLNRAECAPEYNNLESLYKSSAVPHVNKWLLERVYPDRYRPRPPGMFSVDAVRQFLGMLAARLAEEAVDDEQRQKILNTIAETGKEIMASTQPFVEQAIALRMQFGELSASSRTPSSTEPAVAEAPKNSSTPLPVDEEQHGS